MKQHIKKSLCVLISAVILFSTVAAGFMSVADSSHYFNNVNWIDSSTAELEQMWNNDETFIFVLYSSYLDLCRNVGTNVFEKYWMNEYGAKIYGVDVYDTINFGDEQYACRKGSETYNLYSSQDPEYAERYEKFYCPDFIRQRYLNFLGVKYNDSLYPNYSRKNLMPFPIIGFVKNGEFMTLDLREEVGDSTAFEACFPLKGSLLSDSDTDETDENETIPSTSVYISEEWTMSDFLGEFTQYSGFSGYEQFLFDLNKAFFTFIGENPILKVRAIPPGADINPGDSLQTMGLSVVPMHQYIPGANSHNFNVDYNFDGFGRDNNAAGEGVDPYDDDYANQFDGFYFQNDVYEDDYYDFGENNINRNVVWTSSDPEKVTVDQNGKITAVSPFPATVTITCSAEDQRLAPWAPTVQPTSLTFSFEINIIPHNWDIQVLPGNEATCTQNGLRTYACLDEGCRFRFEPYTEVISSDGVHVPAGAYTPVEGSQASCRTETDGLEELKCTNCGIVLDTRTHSWQNSHIWVQVTIAEFSCTTDGHTVEKCTVCGITKENSDKYQYATGHSTAYAYIVGSEPTCTEAGRERLICGVCGEITPGSEREAAPLGHDWGSSYTDENGDTLHRCSRCNVTERVEVRLTFWQRIIAFFRSIFASFGSIFT